MKRLGMDESYAERDLNVGFSGGEKKKAEILQMLMLEPKLAILDDHHAQHAHPGGAERGRGARHGKGRNHQERRRVSGGRDQRKGFCQPVGRLMRG